MAEATKEIKEVEKLFTELMGAQIENFPKAGQALAAPDTRGVYVIIDPKKVVVHVGRTPSGKKGLRQRLQNHLSSASSFAEKYPPLEGKGSRLRGGYAFRCLPVPDERLRALLEAYAIGHLCPAHIGLGLPVVKA
jgi:hypothetical protein